MPVSVRGNLVLVITFLLLGCASGGSGGFGAAPSLNPIIEVLQLAEDNNEINSLPPLERCDHIRIDLRKDCRIKAKEELEELTKAMKKEPLK